LPEFLPTFYLEVTVHSWLRPPSHC
jgi:hypothetical protein